jgi:uncharacterized membrane protein
MHGRRVINLLWVSALLIGGCGESTTSDVCASAPTFDRDIRPSLVEDKCINCHTTAKTGPERRGAPPDLNFDTYDTTLPNVDAFADAITSGRQPPPNLEPPLSTTAEERDLVSVWRQCGFPQ